MHNFWLTPIYALFDKALYREAIQIWRGGRTFLFLLYLVFFYVVGGMLGLVRLSNQLSLIFGKIDDRHPIIQFLAAAPHQWNLTAEGLSILSEDGTPVEKWNFGEWIYIDTTQTGDFDPPQPYPLVASKNLLWTSEGRNPRAIRFKQWHERVGQDVKLYVYRDREDNFDHLEIVGRDGGTRSVTKADLRTGLRFLKFLIVSLIFLFSWPVILLYKLIAILILSLFALAANALSKRGLTYGQIFIVCVLIQSPVLIVHLVQSLVPFLGRLGMLLSWAVSFIYLGVVFYRFLPSLEEGSRQSSGSSSV